MGRRLILDSNILIAYERGRITLNEIAEPDDDVAIPSMVLAEFRIGVELAETSTRAAARQHVLDILVRRCEVLDFTAATAEKYARLFVHARRAGRPRGAIDLMVAAHAAETGRLIVSSDFSAAFADLPDVASV